MPPGRRQTPRQPGYGASQNPTPNTNKRTPTPRPGVPASSYMNPAYQTPQNRQNFADYAAAGSSMLGDAASDPWNNMTPDQYFAALQSALNPGGGYSGGGRGGGGGGAAHRPTDPDPLGWNAIAQQQATEKGYNEMLAALDAKAKAMGGSYDARSAALTGARDSGAATLQALLADLGNQATAANQAVQGTYAAGDSQLQALQNQYSQMVQSRQPAMNQTLTAFGATPAAVSDPSGVQDMITAQRANLGRVGQADAALLANRQNVYNGLNSDVTTQRQMAFDSLMAKLLADRQVADQQAAAERAQLAMQQQQAILQLQAQEQARRAQYV